MSPKGPFPSDREQGRNEAEGEGRREGRKVLHMTQREGRRKGGKPDGRRKISVICKSECVPQGGGCG